MAGIFLFVIATVFLSLLPTTTSTDICNDEAPTCSLTWDVFDLAEADGLSLPYYRAPLSPRLGDFNEEVTIAVIVIHGTNRNADGNDICIYTLVT